MDIYEFAAPSDIFVNKTFTTIENEFSFNYLPIDKTLRIKYVFLKFHFLRLTENEIRYTFSLKAGCWWYC